MISPGSGLAVFRRATEEMAAVTSAATGCAAANAVASGSLCRVRGGVSVSRVHIRDTSVALIQKRQAPPEVQAPRGFSMRSLSALPTRMRLYEMVVDRRSEASTADASN